MLRRGGDVPSPSKRRKIRKGTLSCWECKRRKIRCAFGNPANDLCDGCRSRGTKCVGQEFDDYLPEFRLSASAEKSRQVQERDQQSASNGHQLETQSRNYRQREDRRFISHSPHGRLEHGGDPSALDPTPPLCVTSQVSFVSSHSDITKALVAAWPPEGDLEILSNVHANTSVLFHGVVCQPYADFLEKQVDMPRKLLHIPAHASHPTLIARRLLLLATFLQGVPSKVTEKLRLLRSDCRSAMSQAFNAATRLVTQNDELVMSIDGIECIMLESMYLNNAGSLRRAWLANRRAMGIAQMLGLDTGKCTDAIFLESKTRERIDPAYMWCRLIMSDKYLSLILGLPQNSNDESFAAANALRRCSPLEQFERLQAVAAKLILQRNKYQPTDISVTRKIDKMLLDASGRMPSQWWLVHSGLSKVAGHDIQSFEESMRLTNYISYQHLLIQTHLPYLMLTPLTHQSYEYNKVTAANASRAILSVFVSFCNSTSATAYCRGIDFIAFIASTVLCVAHMEARRMEIDKDGNYPCALQALLHERRSDRALLEQTRQAMQAKSQNNDDLVSARICEFLQPLLAIEEKSAKGITYHVAIATEDCKNESMGRKSGLSSAPLLSIEIPSFGTVCIRPQLGYDATTELHSTQTVQTPNNVGNGGDQGSSQAKNIIGFDDKLNEPSNSEHIPGLSSGEPSMFFSGSEREMQGDGPASIGSDDPFVLTQDLPTDTADWVLQGVDLALFENLTYAIFNTSE